MKVGFIGLGNMGGGMAANILKGGFDLTVHDLRREAASQLLESGAKWAETPRDLASQCDVVFTSLPGPREVEAVALGEGGILEGVGSDAVYIDLSTSSPTLARRILAAFAGKGAHMMHAPVSRGPEGARTGRLAVMAGGERTIYDRCKPVLDAIGDRASYTGGIGSGSICKLMHNCIVYGIQTIAAECYTLGVKAGVDPTALTQAIANGSVGRGNLFNGTFPETYLQGNFDPPHFMLRLAHKDVGLALELGRDHSVPLAMGSVAYQELTSAMNNGWENDDSRKAMLLQEQRAGNVKVRVPKDKSRPIP